jgi:hypothetical protein
MGKVCSAHEKEDKCIKSVGFEILTAVSMKMAVFWIVAACSLVNVGKLLPDFAALQLRRQPSSYKVMMKRHEGKGGLRRPRCIWEANTKMDLSETV